MSLRHTSVRAAAATSLCVGALFAAGGTATAAPSTNPAAPASDTSDLQTFLDSLTRSYNDTIGRSVDEARDSATEQTQANIATAVAVPIANGGVGVASAATGGVASALSYLFIQNLGGFGSSGASALSAAAVPAASVGLPSLSAPAALGPPSLPPPPALPPPPWIPFLPGSPPLPPPPALPAPPF
ncbi:hypothetical protein ACXDF8_09650 [Mycolicibacterium sp. CBM1]